MFPNPQAALPLPPRPNLEWYRNLAKELVKASGAGALRASIERWIPNERPRIIRDVEQFATSRLSPKATVTGAQFVIARSYGFASWPKFAKHVEELGRRSSPAARFEAAADAIVEGDLAALKRLLHEDPGLVRARSTREHAATLLHYVSANGVEGYRQKTPPNIVEIANTLLDAGAEVDATAEVYGGGCTALGLAATSVHPERAGVQEALLQTLLEHGAAIERRSIAGHGQPIVRACLANGRPKAAAFLAARGASVDLAGAAAAGRLDLLEAFFRSGVTPGQVAEAFLYACQSGARAAVAFLIDRGADVKAHDDDGQTALHHAVIGAQIGVVKQLLEHDPPLEAKNVYGGTVLGQALWSAAHDGDSDAYAAIIETLVAAGANVPARHVPVNERIDAVLRRFGSEPEPSWSWQND